MKLPLLYSSALKRNGPEPTTSRRFWKGSVAAKRSGMMKGTGVFRLPSAASSSGKGRFSRKRRRRSSSADNSSVAASSFCPMALRFIQRRRLAVVEAQALAQRDGPEPPALLLDGAFGHLRPGHVAFVGAEQRVVGHVA